MEVLTSLKNPRVQLWRSLKDTKARRETGLFLVEGRKLLEEALAGSFPVEQVLVDEAKADSFPVPEGVPCCALPEHVLAAVCDTRTPQGCAAVVRMPEPRPVSGRVVALDGVQDPGNVGTILRTADAAGLDGVLLSQQCADPFSPKVIRAAMGSTFHLPVSVVADLPEALRLLKRDGTPVLCSQLDGEPFREVCRRVAGGSFCLVIGNEGNGISDPVKALADLRPRLPMRGRAESLNAAVAAGIMMYGLMEEEE